MEDYFENTQEEKRENPYCNMESCQGTNAPTPSIHDWAQTVGIGVGLLVTIIGMVFVIHATQVKMTTYEAKSLEYTQTTNDFNLLQQAYDHHILVQVEKDKVRDKKLDEFLTKFDRFLDLQTELNKKVAVIDANQKYISEDIKEIKTKIRE